MSPKLTYTPVYIGLFAALYLSLLCNAFLDIRYGFFTFEALFWLAVYGGTLSIGWKQHGATTEWGRKWQTGMLIAGLSLALLVFFPVWHVSRAGLYTLAMLQAAMNCVTTTRRNLYLGLLVSLVMAVFAAVHPNADWTMLFYLLPYLVAVVFTLVADQISSQARAVQENSLGQGSPGGQGLAIAASTIVILLLGGILYVLTPQLISTSTYSEFGQLGLNRSGRQSDLGTGNNRAGSHKIDNDKEGRSGQPEQSKGRTNPQTPGNAPGSGTSGPESSETESPQTATAGTGISGWLQRHGYMRRPDNGRVTPESMRVASRRKGMPHWQGATILAVADLKALTDHLTRRLSRALQDLADAIRELAQNHRAGLSTLITAIILAMLMALLRRLLRRTPVLARVWSRFDYLRLAVLGRHACGTEGARQFYLAMERIFEARGCRRPAEVNTAEYLARTEARFPHLEREIAGMTAIFENCRYGRTAVAPADLERMRDMYREIFRRI